MEVIWTEFKKFVTDRELSIQYVEINNNYHLKAFDNYFSLYCILPIDQNNNDTNDFETNFKSFSNTILEVKAHDGRPITRADSRPRGYTTNFISRGDSLNGVGDGTIITWDFSNSNNIITDFITTSIPEGFKRKRIEIGFSDKIYIKEGTIYFFNAPKGQYIDFYVICKSGGYYWDPNGSIPGNMLGLSPTDMYTQAITDIPITHYVNYHHMQGDCSMGDELNTEGASESGLPTQQQGYMIWIEVTTPESDITSNGCAELEIYRERTLLLPGELV